MRGDQLARQWRVTRAIEARPNGLTMAEIAACDGPRGPYRWKALQKPVPKAGMGFFVMGRQSKILLNPFKGTVLIGEGTSLSTSPCFRVLWRQGGDGDDGSQTAGRGWITVVLRKASQIFRLANDLSNLYPMDRKGMRLLDAMLLAMPRTWKSQEV